MNRMIDELKSGSSFLIVSHINPDGDAVGSSLALAAALRAIGKEVTIYNQDPTPWLVQFLPGSDTIINDLGNDRIFDKAIVVDCGTMKQLGDQFNSFKGYKRLLNIDHHATNLNFADVVLIDPDACATACIIYRIIKQLGVKMDVDIATCIYTAISVDSGSFHYGNSNPEAFRTAAEMVEAGVKPWEVALNLYESQPESRIRLLSLSLDTLSVHHNGKIGFIAVTRDMYGRTGTGAEETDGFVNYPRSIKGVEVALFVREISDGLYKASIRSKGAIDITRVAAKFGGGGHVNAAGCNLKGSLEDVRQSLISAAEEIIEV